MWFGFDVPKHDCPQNDGNFNSTTLGRTIGRVPLFRELGHPIEAHGQVEQLLPNFRKPGLPRQPSEGIRHVAIMLASRRVVVAGHAAAYPEGFSPPTSVTQICSAAAPTPTVLCAGINRRCRAMPKLSRVAPDAPQC